MSLETEDLLRELSSHAESVCRHYLPAGKREGSYWIVGDLQNNPGRLRVPRDDGQSFHGMMGACSTRRWAAIPRDRGQV